MERNILCLGPGVYAPTELYLAACISLKQKGEENPAREAHKRLLSFYENMNPGAVQEEVGFQIVYDEKLLRGMDLFFPPIISASLENAVPFELFKQIYEHMQITGEEKLVGLDAKSLHLKGLKSVLSQAAESNEFSDLELEKIIKLHHAKLGNLDLSLMSSIIDPNLGALSRAQQRDARNAFEVIAEEEKLYAIVFSKFLGNNPGILEAVLKIGTDSNARIAMIEQGWDLYAQAQIYAQHLNGINRKLIDPDFEEVSMRYGMCASGAILPGVSGSKRTHIDSLRNICESISNRRKWIEPPFKEVMNVMLNGEYRIFSDRKKQFYLFLLEPKEQ